MSEKPSPKAQIADIKKHGFMRGKSSGCICEWCDRPAGFGWWIKVSYEYGEWAGYCRQCAYNRVHQYDNFTYADLDSMFGGKKMKCE